MDPSAFELFWENSKLSPANVQEFVRRMAEHPVDGPPRGLEHCGRDIALKQPRDSLLGVMRRRRSSRRWGRRPISLGKLSSLLAGLSASPQGTRLYPSAGSTYALETYVVCLRVDGLEGCLCHYNADDHSLTQLAPLSADLDWPAMLNLVPEVELPQAVIVFAALSQRTTPRYGARGGRFVLVEAGHAAQNVALRAAQEGVAAVELGGVLDDEMATLLGLRRLGGKVVLAIAVGI